MNCPFVIKFINFYHVLSLDFKSVQTLDTEYTVPLVLVKTILFKNSDCFIIKKCSTRKPFVFVSGKF